MYIENPNANDPCYKRDALYERDYPPVHNQIVGSGSYYPAHGHHHHHHNQIGGVSAAAGSHLNGVPIGEFISGVGKLAKSRFFKKTGKSFLMNVYVEIYVSRLIILITTN